MNNINHIIIIILRKGVCYIIGYNKLTKKEIRELTKDIPRINIIDNGCVDKESFKQIKFRGKYLPYMISSIGRVFSLHYHNSKYYDVRYRKSRLDKDGYPVIRLRYNGGIYFSSIHRLVATAFVKNHNKEIKTQVNHIDGVKTNNYYLNLEWVTPAENINHAWKNGLSHSINGGNANKPTVMTEDDVIKICELLEQGVPIKLIRKVFGYNKSTIYNILNGHCWAYISNNYDFTKRQSK